MTLNDFFTVLIIIGPTALYLSSEWHKYNKKPKKSDERYITTYTPYNKINENPSKPGYYRVTAEITGSDTVSKLDTTVYAYDEGDAYDKAKRYRTIKLRKEEDHGKSKV